VRTVGLMCSFRALVNLAAVALAAGHGQLTVPLVRVDSVGRRESHEQRAPVYTLDGNRGGYSPTSMRCHDFNPDSDGAKTTLQAGSSFDVTWTMEAGHPGDCYFYVSYDPDPSNAVNFFKIAAIPGCGAPDGLNIPSSVSTSVLLPPELPACEHCVLRWEWTGHQQVVNIEFYVQCADIKIASSAQPVLPSPVTPISGIEHLPQGADGYRKVYNGQGPEEQYLVGPAIATYSSCDANTPGCLGLGVAAISTSSGAAATPTPTTATTDSPTESGSVVPGADSDNSRADSCPLEGFGLPSFVSQCYCGFVASDGAGCGPDDGTACWCKCCCHHATTGSCRYRMTEMEELQSSHAVGSLMGAMSLGSMLTVLLA